MSPKPRTEPSKTRPPAKRRVTLVVPVGDAGAVVATGDFTGWSTEGVRLKRRPDGAWSVDLSLAPGEYQYRLFVDGEWRNNPAAGRRIANAFGSENDVLVVS
jgi:hypothetical protein